MTTAHPNADAEKRGQHVPSDADENATAEDDESATAEDDSTTAEDDAGPAAGEAADREGAHRAAEDEEESAGETAAPPEATDTSVSNAEPDTDTADDEPRGERPRGQRPRDEAPAEKPQRKHSRHALAHHPAGASLLTAAGLVTGLALVPLLFDQLKFEVSARAADAARSAAAPWPAGGEPWFWPGWVATTATIVAVVVLVVAAIGVKVPDLGVLVTAVVLAAATARAAWATFDVLNAHLWELVPVCIVCVIAFGSAVAAAFRWRSPDSADKGMGTGEVAGVTIGAWLLVVLLLLGGSAIASSAETHAFGNVTSPPQDLAGLLSVRAADAPALDDLRGSWVPQVAAAQITDDAAATAYAVVHHDATSRYPTLLARGDDIGAADLDDTWWLSLVAQPFGSQEEAAAWCTTNAVPNCAPRLVAG